MENIKGILKETTSQNSKDLKKKKNGNGMYTASSSHPTIQ